MDDTGLVTRPSVHSAAATLQRLHDALAQRGVTVFAVIDHAAGAVSAGMELRPTTVVIFGNPRSGTPLMQARQEIGLDLPLRLLVWQDASGQVWTTYSDPAWLARRYGLDPTRPPVPALAVLLAGLAAEAGGTPA